GGSSAASSGWRRRSATTSRRSTGPPVASPTAAGRWSTVHGRPGESRTRRCATAGRRARSRTDGGPVGGSGDELIDPGRGAQAAGGPVRGGQHHVIGARQE